MAAKGTSLKCVYLRNMKHSAHLHRLVFLRSGTSMGVAAMLLVLAGCGIFRRGDDGGDKQGGTEDPTEALGSSEFVELCRTLGNSSATAVSGKDGWLFDARELREIARGSSVPVASHREVVDCIADYHQQLQDAGIDLILAPIPQKAVIYAEHLGARRTGRLDSYQQGLFEELESRGVSLVDLVPLLRRERNAAEGTVFPKTGSQLSPRGGELVAGEIVEYLKGRSWTKGLQADPSLVANQNRITLLGNLAGYVDDESSRLQIQPEELPIRAIARRSPAGVEPVPRKNDGRVILITSDQEGLAYGNPGNPAGYDGNIRGSLADQLAYEIGIGLDVHSHSTSGANTARVRLLRASWTNKDLLVRTMAVIWVFSASEFTMPGWRKVPLNLEFRKGEETFRGAPTSTE